jgi:hypothetical protein
MYRGDPWTLWLDPVCGCPLLNAYLVVSSLLQSRARVGGGSGACLWLIAHAGRNATQCHCIGSRVSWRNNSSWFEHAVGRSKCEPESGRQCIGGGFREQRVNGIQRGTAAKRDGVRRSRPKRAGGAE